MDVRERVALVTGGASGIGKATALALAARGARLVIADLDRDGGERTAAEIRESGGTAVFVRCDVTETPDLESAIAQAEALGGLDILFNNAGIGDDDLFADDPGDWRKVVAIDLLAVIDATRLAVRSMRAAGRGGTIVNTASLIGLEPMAGAAVYGAAKAGVVNFTRALGSLAAEWGIRVNAVCPELVDTPLARQLGDERVDAMVRDGAILSPEQIGAAVLRLIEDDTLAGAILKVTVGGGQEFSDG